MDKIFINGLTTTATIGVYAWEKEIKQKIVMDLEMQWDTSLCIASDDVQDCLNYAKVSQAIIQFCQDHNFNLIEKLAHEITNMLLKKFNIPWLKLTLYKPNAVLEAQSVGVVVERYK